MLLVLLAILAHGQHAAVDAVELQIEHAEERLAELEQAVDKRQQELEQMTAQASRLVELLTHERGVPFVAPVEQSDTQTDEAPEVDTGAPEAARENEHAVEHDLDEEGT